ncbi:MAG: M15 family metallopeptidase [Bacillota bacterium]|nr:M15 family metallopeptidase [Bacillota bacterium]
MLNNKKLIGSILGVIAILLVALMAVSQVDESPKPMGLPAQQGNIEVSPYQMVNLQEFIPGIVVDLRYAGDKNVYGEKIYEDDTARLRLGTVQKLKAAQKEFREMGYRLKIWDAYRAPDAQFKLWEIMPDTRYVVNPNTGFSYHSRGVAVDVTLVDQAGNEVPMPSGFDDFTDLANRDFSDIDEIGAANARLLEKVMVKHGFLSIYYEWWHFADSERDQYDVVEHP